MRIAVCFSGQTRSWNQCKESHKILIGTLREKYGAEVDIFTHTWDFNTPPFGISTTIIPAEYNQIQSVSLTNDEKGDLIDFLSPKKFAFDNELVSRKSVTDTQKSSYLYLNKGMWNPTFSASQFYSILKAAELKKQYETENNFFYDICFRIRYDLFLDNIEYFVNNDMVLPSENEVCSCHTIKEESRLGDVFWYSDSQTFDKICDFYNWFPQAVISNLFQKTALTENIFYHYADSHHINIKSLRTDPKIIR